MLKRAKSVARQSLWIRLLICIAVISLGLISTKCCFIDYINGPLNITNKFNWNVDELEGKYITLDVNSVIGEFATETLTDTHTNKTTQIGSCYVCSFYNQLTDTYYLYAARADNETSKHLDKLYSATDSAPTDSCTLTGEFTKLDGELLDYYEQAVKEIDTKGATVEILPYGIYHHYIGGGNYRRTVLIYIIIVICILLTIFFIIRYLTGYHKRYIRQFLQANRYETLQGIEADYAASVEIYKNYRIGRNYIYFQHHSTMSLAPLYNQVWAYYYHTQGHALFIKRQSQIRLFDTSRNMTIINISKNKAPQVLEALAQQCEYMVVGYDPQLEMLFKNNFPEFLNIQYNNYQSMGETSYY